MNASTFDLVLAELGTERRRATDVHGYTDEHDDRHSDAAFAWLILRRASELIAPADVAAQMPPADRRRLLLEVAHIAASAVAAHDRRIADDTPVAYDGRGVLTVPRRMHDDRWEVTNGRRLVTSTDDSWRYVTRPDGDTIERHTLTCALWNQPGDPCPGQTGCWPTADDQEPPA